MSEWQRTWQHYGEEWFAPENEMVLTKIHDAHGERNIQKLMRRGNLWYTHADPNDGMYVYYTPTHWKREQ